MTDETAKKLIEEVSNLSRGGAQGPRGLEAVVLALVGECPTVAHSIGLELQMLRESVDELVEAVKALTEKVSAPKA